MAVLLFRYLDSFLSRFLFFPFAFPVTHQQVVTGIYLLLIVIGNATLTFHLTLPQGSALTLIIIACVAGLLANLARESVFWKYTIYCTTAVDYSVYTLT